jgi:glycosyltransferase involved in cell wall biosynthesis
MIGDGVRLGATRMRIEAAGAASETVFAGRTDQADGPAHLAACDILVSPHVPNADGTPFFGSPTKLFEYMAMGRPIVASRLDQIGEVLVDEETALLVPPGDVDALASAIARLIADSELRARLGAAARARAVEAHTWRAHTRRILDALEARVGPPADA